MKYYQEITLRDGSLCLLRNAAEQDGREVLALFIKTHRQTDYLLTYPEETIFTAEEEGRYLQKKTDSDNEIEIVAMIDGVMVGTAGIDSLGTKFKLRHRCEFGVSVDKAYWGRGVGKALLDACVACAAKAGYRQVELEVVAENERAVALYRKAGFVECGRNPRGFLSRDGYQEVITMRLPLD